MKKEDVKKVLLKVFSEYDVEDVRVEDEEIGGVVERIYAGEGL